MPRTTSTLRCFASAVSPPVSLPTTLPFHSRSLAKSTLRLAELHAVRAHLARLVDHLCRMQQRLGRNAADVQADAAERRPAIDQHHLQPEVRGAKRRGIAAGARAQHQQLRLSRSAAGSADSRSRAAAARCRRWRGGRRQRWRAAGDRLQSALAPAASTRASTVPCETLAPRATSTSTTRPAARRRHIHRRLVGLERDQRRLDLDLIARLDQHVDDEDILEIAEVRTGDFRHAHGTASSRPDTSSSAAASEVLKRAPSAPSMTR